MNTVEAMDLLKNIKYRPSWEFNFSTGFFAHVGDAVIVHCTMETLDTSEYPAFENKVSLETNIFIPLTSSMTPAELYRAVFDGIMDIELHEAREFFRIFPSRSPLYSPHSDAGVAAYGSGDVLR